MIKKIIFFLLAFLVLFVATFVLHDYILNSNSIYLRFLLLPVYTFHFVFSFIISALFLLLSNSSKWQTQLGFLYIFALITKVLFFAIVFKDSIFNLDNLTRMESFNLLIPLFLFLFLEVYFIANILNKK
ncbi:DUF6168 family protein [Olleya aquimaris]|uniref:Uncharacterized protein n=1 Tax=Olleya aquimaris TaxID=639310 RepID=A0A327RM02_9FLAO|nr:hypothetical protein LY08_00199 [Olleya aquimaris]